MSKRDPSFRYSRYEEIPLFLDALDIVHVLGVPKPTVYCMMHAYDFPIISIRGRKLIRKEKLFQWLEKHPFTDAHGKEIDRHPQTTECNPLK